MNKLKIGLKGEALATKFLIKKNYQIIERNFRCKFGEIDIIAKKDNCYIFIEVKTRTSFKYGRPVEAINYRKIEHILKTVNYYLKVKKKYNYSYRIDAIEVLLTNDITINHIKNIIN